MTEKIITGKRTEEPKTGRMVSGAVLTAETVDIRLEVGLIEDFYWDELDNPRINSQHEFKNDDEVVFIINITSPTAIGVDTITGYDYSDVDTECRHDWSTETDPDWNSFWIMIAADFSTYGTPIKGVTADYFCSGILYTFINELNSVSDAYVIKVVECEEEGLEEIIEVCDDGTKKKWRSCEGGEWVYYEQACPVEEAKCPIACVCYGTELIDFLGPVREFRDGVLKRNQIGRKFVNFYYNDISKYLTPLLNRYTILKRTGRIFVRLLVRK